jgi:cytochrome c oxidase accessory protein FixG
MSKASRQQDAANAADPVVAELYRKRAKIYPREISGRFARLRTLAVWVLLGLFYVIPWVRWDDRQMLLFDLPARKFYILWFTFFPQDFLYLTFFLIICALSLFFFTALAGRLWCGYACPQTVWTEVFMWIERKVEGDRARRQKLDRSALTGRKLALKAAKHGIWIVFALWTGFTFVGFFTPIYDLGERLLGLSLGPWETFWVLFYGFATYGNAGWMREQVCTYMCPYARFQSAMFDRDTLVIAYDSDRGEPRGSRRRSDDRRARGLGDCIDCTLCVQVCPTGIDIRDGLQYQCIGCAACIDACDDVMHKMGYPTGLVRYTTENAVQGKPKRVLRLRTVVYASLLALMAAALLGSVLTRTPLGLDVIRDRNALYRETPQGLVENIYTLKLINMTEEEHRYRVEVAGLPGATLVLDRSEITVAGGEVLSLPARVRIDPYDLEHASSPVTFLLQSRDDPELQVTQESRFIGPAPVR